MSNKKKLGLKALLLGIFAVVMVFINLPIAYKSAETTPAADFTYSPRLKLTLLESGTAFPVNGVKLVIPELDYKGTFNSGGIIDIDSSAASLTVLLYKKGYLDTAVFYVPVKNGRLSAYTYYLFKEDQSGLDYIVYTESPLKENIETILGKYR